MKMTMAEHFAELRRRIGWSLLFFCATFLAGLYLAPIIRDIIMAPLMSVWDNPSMIYTGITDGLAVELSMAGLFAILMSAPFILLQAWKYVAPALKKNERKITMSIILISPALFLAGVAFAYFVLLPMMFQFFLDVGAGGAAMMPNMKNYLSFTADLMKAFGIAFQLPLILVILNRAGVLSRRQILSAGRYIIVGIFVLAAILTPPDIISQVAMAAPMILLFGMSILFMV